MKKFYTEMFQRELTPAAALRAAQLEMARDPRGAPRISSGGGRSTGRLRK